MRNRMATYLAVSTAAAFQALADPTRRAVLDLLRRGALPAGQIARERHQRTIDYLLVRPVARSITISLQRSLS